MVCISRTSIVFVTIINVSSCCLNDNAAAIHGWRLVEEDFMGRRLFALVAVMIWTSPMALAQEAQFPHRLDPEGMSRSSNLVPRTASTRSAPQSNYHVASHQEPQQWESTTHDPRTNGGHAESETWRDIPMREPVAEVSNLAHLPVAHTLPLISIETELPPEVSTSVASNIVVRLKNQGPTAADLVELNVDLSDNVEILETQPSNVAHQKGSLYFRLGSLDNGEEKQVQIVVRAIRTGKVELRPAVTATAASRTELQAMDPSVEINVLGSTEVIAGTGLTREIVVINNGEYPIRNLKIQTAFDALINNVRFEGQDQLIQWLAPGETRRFRLDADALKAGQSGLAFALRADNYQSVIRKSLQIAERTIETQISGPELTYKNSSGTYSIDVANEAPTDAQNVQIILNLPQAMEIQVVDREVQYNNTGTRMTWTIPQLRAGQSESIPFKAAIRSTGAHQLRVQAVSNRKIVSNSQLDTHVIGRASLELKINCEQDTVEVGSPVYATIQVANVGTGDASNVDLKLALPESVRAVPSARYSIQGNQVEVEPFDMRAGESQTFKVQLVGANNGEVLIKAIVGCDSTTNSISAEKSMFFFNGLKN